MFHKLVDRVSPITGSRSKMFVDTNTGKGMIENTVNVKEAMRYLKEKRSSHGDKKTSFYNEKFNRGHRLVCGIDPLVYLNHKEIHSDDEALKKFMDRHAEWKQLDVGFTYVKHKNNMAFSPAARKRLDSIFKETCVG